ncbi:hypothetical protein D3C80_984460 [compost metagenome]
MATDSACASEPDSSAAARVALVDWFTARMTGCSLSRKRLKAITSWPISSPPAGCRRKVRSPSPSAMSSSERATRAIGLQMAWPSQAIRPRPIKPMVRPSSTWVRMLCMVTLSICFPSAFDGARRSTIGTATIAIQRVPSGAANGVAASMSAPCWRTCALAALATLSNLASTCTSDLPRLPAARLSAATCRSGLINRMRARPP